MPLDDRAHKVAVVTSKHVFATIFASEESSVVHWPAVIAGFVTVAVGLVVVDAAIAYHVRWQRPAQLRHSFASYSRAWLWLPTTFVYIMAWYLFQPATLTSIFICYEQWFVPCPKTHSIA